jgi:hypothetical protein
MSDISHEINHLIRGVSHSAGSLTSTAITEGINLLYKKPSVKIEVNTPPPNSFQADVVIAQEMAQQDIPPEQIRSYLEAHSPAMARSQNRDAYMHTLMARADQLLDREKHKKIHGVEQVAEISKAVEKAPEIIL